MTVDELIEQLRNLPKDVCRRPIMVEDFVDDGERLLDLSQLTVNEYIVGDIGDGDPVCLFTDSKLALEEDMRENERRWDMPMHAERRATLRPRP